MSSSPSIPQVKPHVNTSSSTKHDKTSSMTKPTCPLPIIASSTNLIPTSPPRSGSRSQPLSCESSADMTKRKNVPETDISESKHNQGSKSYRPTSPSSDVLTARAFISTPSSSTFATISIPKTNHYNFICSLLSCTFLEFCDSTSLPTKENELVVGYTIIHDDNGASIKAEDNACAEKWMVTITTFGGHFQGSYILAKFDARWTKTGLVRSYVDMDLSVEEFFTHDRKSNLFTSISTSIFFSFRS